MPVFWELRTLAAINVRISGILDIALNQCLLLKNFAEIKLETRQDGISTDGAVQP